MLQLDGREDMNQFNKLEEKIMKSDEASPTMMTEEVSVNLVYKSSKVLL